MMMLLMIDDDDDVDIADDTKVSFWAFSTPPRKCSKSDDSREPLRCPAPCFYNQSYWFSVIVPIVRICDKCGKWWTQYYGAVLKIETNCYRKNVTKIQPYRNSNTLKHTMFRHDPWMSMVNGKNTWVKPNEKMDTFEKYQPNFHFPW